MPTPQPLPCPACNYDLGAISTDPLQCPECGGSFDRASLAARRHASTSLALSLVAFGALAAIFLFAAGYCIEYMPRGDQSSTGSGAEASRLLALIPFLALAYGVAMLAFATGQSPLERRWPAVIACAFALSYVVRVGTAQQWAWTDYSRWLQPELWRTVAEWTFMFADGLLLLAAATVLQRILAPIGNPILRRLLNLVCLAALVSVLLALATRLHTLYVDSVNSSPFLPGNSPGPALQPFFQAQALTSSLGALSTITWWLGWPVLGLLALHTRALWKAVLSNAPRA